MELASAFPGASITGVDLSPHMVAVGSYLQQQRRQQQGAAAPDITLLHAAAEDTGLPAGSFDLVAICLVSHELPQPADAAIFAEAFRLLRPGGALAFMVSPGMRRGGGGPRVLTITLVTAALLWHLEGAGGKG